MAHQFLLNQAIGSVQYHMTFWNLLQTMLAAGWTKTQDSDGTTYSPTGTALTTSAKLANDGAWFVVRDPAGKREFCIQHDKLASINGQYYWRIKYSKAAHFTGGSPAAKQVPSATDEAVIFGGAGNGGTDASPTFQMFNVSGTTWVNHTVCCDASMGYSFYTIEVQTGGTTIYGGFYMDALTGTDALDDDPVIVCAERNGSLFSSWTASTNYNFEPAYNAPLGPSGWFGNASYGGQALKGTGYAYWYLNYPGSAGADTWSGKDSAPAPVWCYRSYSNGYYPYGGKGFSSLLRFPGTNQSNLYTYSSTTGTSKDWIYINQFLLFWPDPANAPLNSPGNVTCNPAIDPALMDSIQVTPCGQAEPIYIAAPPIRNPIRHYHLGALDNNGVVQKWVDTAINMVNAPTVIAGYAVTEPKVLGEF